MYFGAADADPTGDFMTGASPWSVKGIASEERELAKQAARRAGVPIGQWLSRQIREAAEEERASRAGARGQGSWRGPDPTQTQTETAAPSPTATAWRSALAAPAAQTMPAPDLPHPPPMAYPSPPVTRPSPPAVDPARVRDLERRIEDIRDLEDRLAALERVEKRIGSLAAELGELAARIDGVEQRAESQAGAISRELRSIGAAIDELRARPTGDGGMNSVATSTAPVERAVMRLAERLQRVEELTLPEERSGQGLLGRLFRR